jgi:outer membrane protein OmpA-like peptidoglycan-associated protein
MQYNDLLKGKKIMKKMMCALAIASMSVGGAMAQQTMETLEIMEVPVDPYRVSTNKFWNNWFVSVGGGFTSGIRHGDKNWSDLFFDENYGRWGFDVAVGKWFTPGLALRLKFNGLDGAYEGKSMDQRVYRAEAMFNLSNMLCGYSDSRVWNVIPFAGMAFIGGNSGMDIGLQSNWRLNQRMSLYLEAALFMADRHGKMLKFNESYNRYMNFSAGITFNLGKTGFQPTPDVDDIMALNMAQLDALNAVLAEQQAENNQLKNQLAQKPREVVKTQTVYQNTIPSIPQSVFFNIGSSEMASSKETVNLQAIADAAKESESKIHIVGYADSATGDATYNQTLSLKRAETVAAALEKMGINRNRMVIEGKGGVDTLQPDSYNRRVIITMQ